MAFMRVHGGVCDIISMIKLYRSRLFAIVLTFDHPRFQSASDILDYLNNEQTQEKHLHLQQKARVASPGFRHGLRRNELPGAAGDCARGWSKSRMKENGLASQHHSPFSVSGLY